MAKYIDELTFVGTNQMKTSSFNPIGVLDELGHNSHAPYLNEYRARVIWEKTFCCSHSDFPAAMKDVRNQLRRDVYGEFRDTLLELNFAVLEHDREKAIKLIQALMEMVM